MIIQGHPAPGQGARIRLDGPPPGAAAKGGAMIRLERLLAPPHFSESARPPLAYGIPFAREYEAELLLLHVVETVPVGYASDLFPVPMAEVFQEMSGYARTELGKLADEVRAKGIRV